MSKLFTGSLDVAKIAKELIQTKDKDGNPFKNGAKYINVSIWLNDEPDKYGNMMSIQQYMGKDSTSKNYLGNLKEFKMEGEKEATESVATSPQGEDELPF